MTELDMLRWDPDSCSIARTLALVGDKWSLVVLREAFLGVRRFDDLRRRTGAPRQVLSARLASLVEAGVLRRQPYQEPGRRTREEYRLTRAGVELFPVLVALMRWGDAHLDHPAGGPPLELVHHGCGEPVDAVLECRAGHHVGSALDVRPALGPGGRLLSADDPRATPSGTGVTAAR